MAQSAPRGASAPRANLRAPSLDLKQSAFDASDEVARRLDAFDALAKLLHEQRDLDCFGCLTPAALEQMLTALMFSLRASVDRMNEANRLYLQEDYVFGCEMLERLLDRRMQACDALATLLHEQRDPDCFGCLTPVAAKELLQSIIFSMRDTALKMIDLVDKDLERGD